LATDFFQALQLERVRRGETDVVVVTGEVDVASSPVLRSELRKLIAEGSFSVELDLKGMTFIDSTGIGVLVGTARLLRHNGGDLRLVNPHPSTIRVLEITGLTRIFTIKGER
jgi:anti-sigma B factor antagonist